MLTTTRSGNAKLGLMASTYRGKQTCPLTCAAYKACYSKFGHGNIQFDRATKQGIKEDAKQIFQFITTLPFMHKVRHFVAGDFTSDGKKLDKGFVQAMIKAHEKRPDIRAFGYTHAWRLFKKNPFKQASLTINASCETGKEVKAARAKGFDTVMIVPSNTPHGKSKVDGINVLVCPNQSSKAKIEAGMQVPLITCDNCMLCFKKNRDYTVGFLPHGIGKSKLPVS